MATLNPLKDIKKKGYKVLYSCNCAENVESIKNMPLYAVVCDFSLLIYKKKEMVERDCIEWLNIKKITAEKDYLTLVFNKKTLKLFPENFENFFGAVKHVLLELLDENELYSVNKEIFHGLPRIQSINGILIRYSEVSRLMGKMIAPSNVTLLEKELERSPNKINMNIFSDPFYIIPPMLNALHLYNGAKSLILNSCCIDKMFAMCHNHYKEIAKYEHLEITTKTTRDFKEFCTSIACNDCDKRLTSIAFDGTNFTVSELKELIKMIKGREIISLGLKNISVSSLYYFEHEFFRTDIKDTIRYLSFKGTHGLQSCFDMSSLLPQLNYITVLSFENCDVEISEILYIIDKMNSKNLRALNLSGNFAKHMPIEGFQLPRNLQSIYLDNITWAENSLRNILMRVLGHPYINKISLKKPNVEEREWKQISRLIKQSDVTQLQTLIWDECPVNEDFMDFVCRNKYIEYLSLSGDFSCYKSKIAALLVRYLKTKPLLASLIIRGSAKNYLGNLMHTVIMAAMQCPNLRKFDISGNKITDKCATQLKEVYEQKSELKEFNFEGTSVQFFSSLKEVLQIAASNDTIKTNIPFTDIKRFVKDRQITQKEAEGIVDSFRKRPHYEGKPLYEGMENSPFLEPFEYYVATDAPNFPEYITKEEEKKLEIDEETESIFTTVSTVVSNEEEDDDSDDYYMSKRNRDVTKTHTFNTHTTQNKQDPGTPQIDNQNLHNKYPNLKVDTGVRYCDSQNSSFNNPYNISPMYSSMKASSKLSSIKSGNLDDKNSIHIRSVNYSLNESEILKTLDDDSYILSQLSAKPKNKNGFEKRPSKIEIPSFLN